MEYTDNLRLQYVTSPATFFKDLWPLLEVNWKIIDTAVSGKQDTMTAGPGISIQNGVISAALFISITYSDLVALRNSSSLIPGAQYRITDYACTTVTNNTSSAGHQFDIIVKADSASTLNENAHAIQHSGDTYFANSDLKAWELKYCIDNDTNRFAWADTTNGKGVIYYMKDEFNNECPYDFKNILFRDRYTFTGENSDASIDGLTNKCHSNVIKEYIIFKKQSLNFNVFYSDSSSLICYNNTLGTSCHSNTFGNNCFENTFGNECYNNTFGAYCFKNTFGTYCESNTFGNSCSGNTFGNNCDSNTFGNNCSSNTFGNNCDSNTFGNNCSSNTFGNNCRYNRVNINYCQYIIFDNGCSYINLSSEDTEASSSNYLQNVHVRLGVKGTDSTMLDLTVPDRNLPYETDCYLDSSGNLKVSRFDIPQTLTAGAGISIENGVISVSYANADEEAF